mgnify:FL=1
MIRSVVPEKYILTVEAKEASVSNGEEIGSVLANQGIITIPIKAAKSKRFLISIYNYIADILF